MRPTRYRDRVHAGQLLGERLGEYRTQSPVVLGLPRGGVVVAGPVATALEAPLDVVIVRKLGVPFQPELAMGAIGEGGVRVIEESVMASAGVRASEVAEVEDRERAVIESRSASYRQWRPAVPLKGRVALIVDDGIATGATARAACQVVAAHDAGSVVVATPVASLEAIRRLRSLADDVVCLQTPSYFYAIGAFYADFSPVDDEQVREILIGHLERHKAEGESKPPVV